MVFTGVRCGHYITTKLLIFYAKIGELGVARNLFDRMPTRGRRGMERADIGVHARPLGGAGGGDVWRDAGGGAKTGPVHVRLGALCVREASCAGAGPARAWRHGQVGGHRRRQRLRQQRARRHVPQVQQRRGPERNVTMWTAVISGHGQHGHVREALALFQKMMQDGFRPNDVTFLAVLSSCAHGGLVDEGLRHFSSIPSDYGLTPKAEHYAAVVDMLARVGRLRDAYELVKKLPDSQEHSVVWGALLGACRKHGGDVKLVELVARRFFQLQPGNAGKYVVLANTYAACDMWDSVAGMHEAMKSLGIRKDPAWSAVEVQGKKHFFLARDTYHDECSAIYEACNALARTITEHSVRAIDGMSYCNWSEM
ncbi:hypothetical protein ACQ4PT_055196 [Festuca glaucescens]